MLGNGRETGVHVAHHVRKRAKTQTAKRLFSPGPSAHHRRTRVQIHSWFQCVHKLQTMSTRKRGQLTIEDRIVRAIRQRKGTVVLRSEVAPLGSTTQVGRILAKLVANGALVRVSKGVYAKTHVNKFTGRLSPAAPFETIAAETFRRLGIAVAPGRLAREYNEGSTTQIPMDGVVSTGARRITRRIRVGSKTVKYESNRE